MCLCSNCFLQRLPARAREAYHSPRWDQELATRAKSVKFQAIIEVIKYRCCKLFTLSFDRFHSFCSLLKFPRDTPCKWLFFQEPHLFSMKKLLIYAKSDSCGGKRGDRLKLHIFSWLVAIPPAVRNWGFVFLMLWPSTYYHYSQSGKKIDLK